MRFLIVTALLAALGCAHVAEAGTTPRKRSWTEEKCVRYTRDWSEALRRLGETGLSREFIEGNAAFIKRGCTGDDKVCPRSARDWQLVDALTILVVNQGMSSTFLPFFCGR